MQALRAQSDRNGYSREMRRVLEAHENITLIEGEVGEVLTTGTAVGAELCSARDGKDEMEDGPSGARPLQSKSNAVGVLLTDGRVYNAPRVVICPGTFTRAECFMGERRHKAGRWGETGRAIVVTKPDVALSAEDVLTHCAGLLARYKLPQDVIFTDALPRNATGKIHKPTLRERFGAPAPA